MGRSLVTMDDLSSGEMEGLFNLADEMGADMPAQSNVAAGKIMASLFFEPSTRTRLSFEAAMNRLGGRVITVTDPQATSLAKGESLADMARIVGGYADIIVIRHPWEGAARVVADYAGVPVINAGDGGHQHPTQTLCDIYTLRKERGTVRGLKIALWGDLKYGRTIHSLIFALAKFGADIVFCPSPGLEVPDHVIKKLIREYGGEVKKSVHNGRKEAVPIDAMYVTPSSPHQLAMMPGLDLEVELKTGVDALYVTRPQKERFTAAERDQKKAYPIVDEKLLSERAFRKSVVMHPLPRVDELAVEVDADPRSRYFRQAHLGVPVRMALISALLGAREIVPGAEATPPKVDYPSYEHDSAVRCPNPRCVSVQESETKYIKPLFKIVDTEPLTLRCVYCEHGFEPAFIASSEWHDGTTAAKRYHRANSHWAQKIKPENLIVFTSAAEAQAMGFQPSRFAGEKAAT